MGKSLIRLILVVAALLLPLPKEVHAQSRRAMSQGRKPPPRPEKALRSAKQTPIEQFKRMTPVERQQELAKLPVDRRDKLQRQLEHYDQMTPAQKERLDWFNQLPPGRQKDFRNAFERFKSQPQDRRQAMRQELQHLKNLPEEDRQSRLASPDFHSRYSKDEQHILTDMAGSLQPE